MTARGPMTAAFWETQPVGCGDDAGPLAQPPAGPSAAMPLPDGLRWATVADAEAVARFLNDNYVGGSDKSFQLCYSPVFFRSLFASAAHHPLFGLGLFAGAEMVGYAQARRHRLVVNGVAEEAVSVNFLCLTPALRRRGLAPLVIQEIRRIANTVGIFCGVFTAQQDHGFSLVSALYYHLPLDPQYLATVEFLSPRFMNVPQPVFRCRSSTRPLEAADIPHVLARYRQKYARTGFYEELSTESLTELLAAPGNVICTLVNPETGDFASYFTITTRNLKNGQHFATAYLYYWAGGNEIIEDAVATAQRAGIALFNALDCGENQSFIDAMDFLEGTGVLHYHLYNWKARKLTPKDLNFILF